MLYAALDAILGLERAYSSATTLSLVNSIYAGTNPIREIHAEGLRGGTTITVAGEIFADNTTFQ